MIHDAHKIPITILICDDDEDDRMLTRQALEEAHISNSLRFVENGEQLLDYLYQRGRYAGESGKASRPARRGGAAGRRSRAEGSAQWGGSSQASPMPSPSVSG